MATTTKLVADLVKFCNELLDEAVVISGGLPIYPGSTEQYDAIMGYKVSADALDRIERTLIDMNERPWAVDNSARAVDN